MTAALGEFELIRRFFTRAAPSAGAAAGVELGIGDDAAVLRIPAGEDLVAAVDTIVEGRHFPHQSDPRSIGHRALAVNLSDMAAMGAQPAWALLALTMPAADPVWLEQFAGGLLALADRYGVTLVGGDTTAGPLTISVQILGHVPRGTALRRSGGADGDLLVVSGTLGDASMGLDLLQRPRGRRDLVVERELVQRFEYPTPRVELGLAARGIVNAAMDLSDGLAGDLPKLAAASGLAAHVAIERLPLSAALRSLLPAAQARNRALGGGDDYELLLAVSPQRYQELAHAATRLGVALTVIGELHRGSGVSWSLDGTDVEISDRGFDHFR
ncbi:MAG: thiamine-phosphate kinase [Steroidobacterales bacterium]